MKGWNESELSDLVVLQRGFDITKAEQHIGSIPIISSSGISSYHNQAKCKAPGVITGRKGTLGKVFYSNREYWPHDTTLWVKDFKGNSPKYAYYFLQLLKLETYDVGASNPTLNRNHVHKLKIKIPPHPIQRKIAAILSAYDDLIENNNRRIAILEKMAEELYREWFVRLRFPGHEKVKIVKGVPEGWEEGYVGDLCEVKSGFAFKSEDLGEYGHPVIKITNIQNGYIDTANFQRFSGNISSRIAQYELFDSDLLIAMTGAQVGKCGVFIGTNERFFLNQRVGKFTNKTNFNNLFFLYIFCKTDIFTSQIDNFALGAAQPNICSGQIESIKLIIPTQSLLTRFQILATPTLNKITFLKKQNDLLTTTRDRLLTRLMSNKIDVEKLDIHFPASMQEEVSDNA